MKLRIKGNSLRLRVMRSEVSRLAGGGHVEETVHFPGSDEAALTYALVFDSRVLSPQVQYKGRDILVMLPRDSAIGWAESDQVGVYATIGLGRRGVLDLIVEKDFACLDLSDADNLDTFPNVRAGLDC